MKQVIQDSVTGEEFRRYASQGVLNTRYERSVRLFRPRDIHFPQFLHYVRVAAGQTRNGRQISNLRHG
jgi:hypothetical protein